MANEKITIKMVSEKAKVSKTTVSRYLNGKYEFMSAQTRKRIEEVIEELDYRPNAMAQSLKNNKTGLIGLVVADITNPFSTVLIKGVNDACSEKAFQIVLADADNTPEKERESIQSLIDRQVEGMIISTTGGNEDFINTLRQQGIKIVLADRVFEEHVVDTVTTDNEKATAEMIKHVYVEGFDKIAFFSQALSNSSRVRRHKFFLEVSRNMIDNPEDLVYIINEKDENIETYQNKLQNFIDSHPDERLAIFTANGETMFNLINAINNLGVRIPEDIGVCGYDDWGWTSIIAGGISVISRPTYDVGYQSAELLIKRIEKNKDQYKPKYIELDSKVKIRKSTKI